MLTGSEAIDISRITGIPWAYRVTRTRGEPEPTIDLHRLDWWDRFRVAFARVGAHYFLDHKEAPWGSGLSSSAGSSFGLSRPSSTTERHASEGGGPRTGQSA